jgi:hypothetical protein
MKKVIFKTIEFLTGAKMQTSNTAIKGRKGGGNSDSKNVGWENDSDIN